MKLQAVATLIFLLLLAGCSNPPEEQPADRSSPTDTVTYTPPVQNADSFTRNKNSVGQLIYVPVYSHIYQQDHKKTFNLTTTLSIRNSDPFRSLTIIDVSYYDSQGNLIQQYLEQSQKIESLASSSFVVEERDLRGGVGANFLVSWQSTQPVTPPVVEAVMISTSQQQGISFLSEGRVIQEYQPNESGDE